MRSTSCHESGPVAEQVDACDCRCKLLCRYGQHQSGLLPGMLSGRCKAATSATDRLLPSSGMSLCCSPYHSCASAAEHAYVLGSCLQP